MTPASRRKPPTKQAQKVEGITFETLAHEWFAYNAPHWAESTTYKAKLYLENDLIPGIGSRALKSITRPELVELVRKVEARCTLNAAGKIRQWLHQIFRYGLAKGVVDTNPATDLSVVAAPAKAARHHPHVPFAELPDLLSKCEAANVHTLTRHAIKLLILTAVRPGELRQLTSAVAGVASGDKDPGQVVKSAVTATGYLLGIPVKPITRQGT